MSPGIANSRTRRKSTPKEIAGAKRRQDKRLALGKCLLSASHGDAYRAKRCRSCYERTLAQRTARYVSRPRVRGAEITGAVYAEMRARVVAEHWATLNRSNANYATKIIAEVERRLRRFGRCVVRAVNEAPPGWTVEEDRREELLALGELTLMRKIA